MTRTTLRIGVAVIAGLVIGCGRSDFPTAPSPVAQTPLTTIAALKVDGSASVPGGGLTPISMTLIARSVDATAPETQAQAPGTTELSGAFVLGTGVRGTVSGSIDGSLQNGTLSGTLRSDADGCTRQYNGPVSANGIAWLATDSDGSCPLPISVQASRADAPSACTYSVSAVGPVSASGASAVVEVATGPTCTWVVEPLAPWLRITGSATGMGPGTVTVVVDPTNAPRQGTVLVAGQPVRIEQSPACTLTVAPASLSFPETGGNRSATISVPAGCEWRAENLPPWLSISPVSGSGTTTVTLVAQPNTGAEREASFRVNGQIVALTQAGRPGGEPQPCIQGVALSAAAFPHTGGAGSIDVTAPGGCAWSAEADIPWVLIAGGSGSGSGTIRLTVEPNAGSERTGTIRVGGRVLTITQAAPPEVPPCNYTITLSSGLFPASGGTGAVNVTTQPQCSWAVQSLVDWITPPSREGQGTGTAAIVVAPNPLGIARQGEMRILGQSLTVTQEPLLASVRVSLISSSSFRCFQDCFDQYGGGSVVAPPGFSCSIAEDSVESDDSDGPLQRQEVCIGNFPVGLPVTFTAQADESSVFNGWGGACDGAVLSCTITVSPAGHSLSATFSPAPVEVGFLNMRSGGRAPEK